MDAKNSPADVSNLVDCVDNERQLIRLVTASASDEGLFELVKNNRSMIDLALARQGGILFRGFAVDDIAHFQSIAEAYAGELQSYQERSTPRTAVGGRVYTSTEYPPEQTIPQHTENSYAYIWPRTLYFHCSVPATQGGETPLADSREVLLKIPEPIRREFTERKILYVRNIGGQLDLPWQTVFQTDSKSDVERRCDLAGTEYEWLDNGKRLRARSVLPAMASHPVTGEALWFNQAHLFHVSNLPAEVVDYLYATMNEEDFPRNTYFGDGTPIPQDALMHIRQAYQSSKVDFGWRKGDFLILDNMMVTHGRKPYRGDRQILVAMSQPWSDHG